MSAPATRILVRTDVDWSRMDRRAFLAQRDPTRPVAFVSSPPLDLWDEVYRTDFFDYRAQLQEVAYGSFRRAGADALSFGLADLDEWWDDPTEELVVPMDDDDLLSGPLEGLARRAHRRRRRPPVAPGDHPVKEDGSMGWRRPEMRCIFATNCALRKSFLRRHFDRDGLLRVLADHRAANDAVGDVLGVDAADFVLPGFRRLRHPRVGFVAHEWSLKNGHVGSIQQLQQALGRDDPPAFLRGLGLEVQRPLPGWAEPFAPDIEALASVWSALRASVRQTAGRRRPWGRVCDQSS